jgi:hypothetical protein
VPDVELNLRIPSLAVRGANAEIKRIDNQSVRFKKRIVVAAIPKPGDVLQVTSRHGEPFDCTVTRADWSESAEIFVVSCNYARRSIEAGVYDALVADPDWSTVQLP